MADQVRSQRSSSSIAAISTLDLDPNQLLTTCQSIRENMSKLDRQIQLAQLRLATLHYLSSNSSLLIGAGDDERGQQQASTRCSHELVELCNLSQLVVHQMDQLNAKLALDAENSISYQIAFQQLALFTGEWHDELTGKFNDTFAMAERLQLFQAPPAQSAPGEPKLYSTLYMERPAQSQLNSDANRRILEALLRLRQSFNENDRLIATIANDVEHTKTTIEAIQDSLQSTKANLSASERNTAASIALVRGWSRWKLLGTVGLAVGLLLVVALVFRLLGLT